MVNIKVTWGNKKAYSANTDESRAKRAQAERIVREAASKYPKKVAKVRIDSSWHKHGRGGAGGGNDAEGHYTVVMLDEHDRMVDPYKTHVKAPKPTGLTTASAVQQPAATAAQLIPSASYGSQGQPIAPQVQQSYTQGQAAYQYPAAYGGPSVPSRAPAHQRMQGSYGVQGQGQPMQQPIYSAQSQGQATQQYYGDAYGQGQATTPGQHGVQGQAPAQYPQQAPGYPYYRSGPHYAPR